MLDLFGNAQLAQSALQFPVALTERYRPRVIDEFAGLAKPKAICSKLAANPFPSAWLFVGPSGTGKTTMALALAEAIPAEIHHIPSQECTVQRLREVVYSCHMMPMSGCKMHLILVDEGDRMTEAAKLYLLSKLDSTGMVPNTVWVFTCNDTAPLKEAGEEGQGRFVSRTRQIEFSSYGIASSAIDLLRRIWDENAPSSATVPNFQRIVKESNNNLREALMKLETELMLAI